MELSLFLAQLFGLTMILFMVSLLLKSDLIDRMINDLRTSAFSMAIAGFVGVMGGLAVILTHNIWEMNWRGLVTFFGWAAVLKGITYIAFPELITGAASKMMSGKCRKVVMVVALLAGCYLTYYGFGLGG